MKKLIITAIMVSVMGGFAGVSQAAITCVNPDHAIWNDLNNAIVDCIPASQWQKGMAEAATRNDKKLPYVAPGKSVTDEGGISDTCPNWYQMGCVDITKTEKYRQDMISIAKQLIATNQISKFPRFAGWATLVR